MIDVEEVTVIFLAILGQYALLIAVMVQNGSMKTSIEGIEKWKDGIDTRFHNLEIEHAENHHGRPSKP